MTGQQLKNSILQLAIQGKLVPQDPNDEPASELLKRIRAEKEQFVKDGKLKKKDLVTTPVSDEGKPFAIPESWEWCRWGELSFNIQYGYNAPALTSGDIRMVRISDIHDGKVLWDNVPYCNITEEEKSVYLLRDNDILFARTGGTVGKSFLVSDVPYPSVYAGYLIRTQYDSTLLDPKYLKMFMDSDVYWRQLKDGTTSTAQPNCNGKTLSNMVFPLPPLAEQHRIVAKIEELIPLVEEYDKAQNELNALNTKLPEALKKSVLQEAIMGKLVPQDPNDEPASELLKRIRAEKEQLVKDGKLKKKDLVITPVSDEEKPFEIPKNWEWARLMDLCTKIVDGDHNPPAGLSKRTEFLMISSQNIDMNKLVNLDQVRFLSEEVFQKEDLRTTARIDDILFTSVGTLGRSCVLKQKMNLCFQRSVTVIRTKIFNKYLKYVLDSPFIQSFINENATGTAQKGFYINQMERLLVPLPPLAEQHRIVERLEQILSKIEKM